MPKLKLKTKKAAKKRFNPKAKGIKRKKAYRSHLLSGRSKKRKRHLRKGGMVSKAEEKRIRKVLPYS